MNPRQRRGAILMILASIGAVAVFVAVLSYVSAVRAEVGDFRTVLQLKADVAAYHTITASTVEERQVPKKWLGGGSFVTDVDELEGKVAVKDLKKGSYLNDGMIIDAPQLQAGQREIAILIDAETGVAGKVKPGSLVDIVATFSSTNAGQEQCAKRVIPNARVIDVGQQTSEKENNDQGQAQLQAVVPITFALSPTQSLELARVEAYADKVRLARIGPGSTNESNKDISCGSS